MAPFRLLDLPQELQDKIYKHYFESTRLVLPVREGNVASLAVEQACRKVNQDVRSIREETWPTDLYVNGDIWCLALAQQWSTKGSLRWLAQHICSAVLRINCDWDDLVRFEDDNEYHALASQWSALVEGCPKLRRIRVDFEDYEPLRRTSLAVPNLHTRVSTLVSVDSICYLRDTLIERYLLSGLATRLKRRFGEDFSLTLRVLRLWKVWFLHGSLTDGSRGVDIEVRHSATFLLTPSTNCI